MKKGVTLRVQVYIEGDDPPANDFSKTGQNFILQVLAAGMKNATSPYMLGVKKLDVLEGSDGDDDSDDSSTEDDSSSGFLASWTGTGGTGGATNASGSANAARPGGTSGTSGTSGSGGQAQ